MDLGPSDDQRLIVDVATKYVANQYATARREAAVSSSPSFSTVWKDFAELGWLGLAIPEEFGGYGADAATIGLLMEVFGRGLVAEPYLSTAVLSARVIAALGADEQKADLLPAIVEGKSILAFAHIEPDAGFDASHVTAEARNTDGSWCLSGRKAMVLGGPNADTLLVSAREFDADGVPRGVGVFLVPSSAVGLKTTSFQTVDGSHASNIVLKDVSATRLGRQACAMDVIEETIDFATALMMYEAIGCMHVLLDETVTYSKTRVQFGKPLAANQVLRHRMVTMLVKLEEARASALRAVLFADAAAPERAKAVSSAKVKVGQAGRFIAQQAVQLHGGMGVTQELNVGAYFKRLLSLETVFGSPDFHLRRYAQTLHPAIPAN